MSTLVNLFTKGYLEENDVKELEQFEKKVIF